MASELIEELKTVATEAKRGCSRQFMSCPSGGRGRSRERGRNSTGRSRSSRRGGRGGEGEGRRGEGEGRGEEGGARGRGSWTVRTMGGSVGNPA